MCGYCWWPGAGDFCDSVHLPAVQIPIQCVRALPPCFSSQAGMGRNMVSSCTEVGSLGNIQKLNVDTRRRCAFLVKKHRGKNTL